MRVILIGSNGTWAKGTMTPYLRKLMLADLTILAHQYRDTPWVLKRPEEALEEILDGDDVLIVFPDNRLMCASLVQPWFSKDWVLSEEWVGHGLTTDEVIRAMRMIAKTLQVKRIVVGTRAAPGQRHEAVARRYQQQGLRLATIVLEDEVHECKETEEGRDAGDGPA